MQSDKASAIAVRLAAEVLKEQMGIDSKMENALVNFFVSHPFPDDDDIHSFAEKSGYDTEQVEAGAYRLATFFAQFMRDGRANENGFEKKEADPKELKMGIEVELEHTPNRLVAERIALDHLAEVKDYYTRLKKMEAEAGVKG